MEVSMGSCFQLLGQCLVESDNIINYLNCQNCKHIFEHILNICLKGERVTKAI